MSTRWLLGVGLVVSACGGAADAGTDRAISQNNSQPDVDAGASVTSTAHSTASDPTSKPSNGAATSPAGTMGEISTGSAMVMNPSPSSAVDNDGGTALPSAVPPVGSSLVPSTPISVSTSLLPVASSGLPTLGDAGPNPVCDTDNCAEQNCEVFPNLDPAACLTVCTLLEFTIALDSDAAVDELAQRECQVINGSLMITGSSISSLLGLEGIRRISGALVVQDTTSIFNLHGLEGLTEIGGDLVLSGNANLASLDGLSAMKKLEQGMVILDNPTLPDFQALSHTTFAEASFTLANNEGLISLDGLEGVTRGTGIVLASNHQLESIAGLSNLTVVSDMTLTDNTALSAAALSELTDAQSVTVAGNTEMVTFSAPKWKTGNSIIIASNPAMTSVNLNSLETSDNLSIADNAALQSIGELPSLMQVGALYLTLNPQLPQCSVDAIAERLGACADCSDNDATAICE